MGGRVVEVEILFLDVFAVAPLVASEAEEAFFEDGIAAVPQRQRETDALMAVADAGQSVLVPPISPRPRMVVRKVLPGAAVGAVVFAHRAPRALAQERTPAVPVGAVRAALLHADLFFRDHVPHLAGKGVMGR